MIVARRCPGFDFRVFLLSFGQWYSMMDAANWLLTIKVVVTLPALITGDKCHELKALLCMLAPECQC